jgi:hypothetical protein
MSKLRVNCFTLSVDGYGAGPNQGRENPLGVGGRELHKWYVPTRTFKSLGHHARKPLEMEPARAFADPPITLR